MSPIDPEYWSSLQLPVALKCQYILMVTHLRLSNTNITSLRVICRKRSVGRTYKKRQHRHLIFPATKIMEHSRSGQTYVLFFFIISCKKVKLYHKRIHLPRSK
ncbi:predicted protein [Sclerotinia sclerotiorum 1980 UF-70]|uniref:Uncharacterized protein n=1 Tax=Sclerotinia sclerotiorum (strain ATCC 18683 / 1980 / Ss-1) TaxID=665079 RepID=A7EEA8_SCLS1|nr:predicted protein [Sclerotinia sclerotiorum 1980 UF-70]EDO01174.1 predicted protein [Sclerotinia sclerotiorum 1980 UF-70]